MVKQYIDIHCNTGGCSICRHVNKLCPGRKAEEWEADQGFSPSFQAVFT